MVNKMVNKLRKKLTEKQEKILDALEEFILEHGYSPTIRQLGKLVRIASPSAVYKHILSLENRITWVGKILPLRYALQRG
jgi:repressor LexA